MSSSLYGDVFCCVHLEGSAPPSQFFKYVIDLVSSFCIFHMMYNHVLAVFVTIPPFQVQHLIKASVLLSAQFSSIFQPFHRFHN
jgi:hypothetical protein